MRRLRCLLPSGAGQFAVGLVLATLLLGANPAGATTVSSSVAYWSTFNASAGNYICLERQTHITNVGTAPNIGQQSWSHRATFTASNSSCTSNRTALPLPAGFFRVDVRTITQDNGPCTLWSGWTFNPANSNQVSDTTAAVYCQGSPDYYWGWSKGSIAIWGQGWVPTGSGYYQGSGLIWDGGT